VSKDKVDWSAIYDVLASEYGWTLEYIHCMTKRHAAMCMTKINDRKYYEYSLQADLHGRKIKEREHSVSNDSDISDELRDKTDRAMEKIIARKKLETAKHG